MGLKTLCMFFFFFCLERAVVVGQWLILLAVGYYILYEKWGIMHSANRKPEK